MRSRKSTGSTGKAAMHMLVAIFALSATAGPAISATIGSKVLRGAAIGFVVTKAAGPLDKFINTVTLRHNMKSAMATKVVPILSVGDKGYIGGAQVSGPATYIKDVKAVFQYEKSFSTNNYRAKVLVPSSSINPLQLKRVQKVGVTALIDVALDGGRSYTTVGTGIQAGDVIRGGAVLVAVKNFGSQINKGLNTITFNNGLATKVVPMGSIGEKTYLGAAQVSASSKYINSVNAVWQYDDTFDSGKFRVKIVVPTTSSNPLKMKRVDGAGVTAVVDMALSQQKVERKDTYRSSPWDQIVRKRVPDYRGDKDRYESNRDREDEGKYYLDRKDNGKHKGWYKGKRNGRKNEQVDKKWREKLGSLIR